MGKLLSALILMLTINFVLFFLQLAATELNPTGTDFFTYAGTPLSTYDTGNYTLTTDVGGMLPGGESGISADSGSFFTDPFNTLKSWFYANIPGLSILTGFVTAVPNFLKALHLPEAFTFVLSAIWFITSILLIAAFWLGRDV